MYLIKILKACNYMSNNDYILNLLNIKKSNIYICKSALAIVY